MAITTSNGVSFTSGDMARGAHISCPVGRVRGVIGPMSGNPRTGRIVFLSTSTFNMLPPISVLGSRRTRCCFLSNFATGLTNARHNVARPAPAFSTYFNTTFLDLRPAGCTRRLMGGVGVMNTGTCLIGAN